MDMEELVRKLDENLDFVKTQKVGDTLEVWTRSTRKEAECPYCHQISSSGWEWTVRAFQDIPVNGEKTRVMLEHRRFKCKNPACSHSTFAERFDCIEPYSRRTDRLTDRIVDTARGKGSDAATRSLADGTCDVSRSTVYNLINRKKGGQE